MSLLLKNINIETITITLIKSKHSEYYYNELHIN